MQNCKPAAWVLVDPRGQIQGISFMNDDGAALRNELRNLSDLDERGRIW